MPFLSTIHPAQENIIHFLAMNIVFHCLFFWDSQQDLLRSRYRPDSNIKSSIPTSILKIGGYTYSEHMASWRAFIRPLPSQAGATSWSLGEVIIAYTGDPDALYYPTAGILVLDMQYCWVIHTVPADRASANTVDTDLPPVPFTLRT